MLGFETPGRSSSKTRPLIWVDYLCIDQGHVNERNHQVNLMRVVYSKAKCVAVWLGMSADDSELVIEYIKTYGSFLITSHWLTSALSMTRFLTHKTNKEAAEALMKRPYWSRLWVVQEVMLAEQLLMCLGQESLMVDAQKPQFDFPSLFDHLGILLGVELPSLLQRIVEVDSFFSTHQVVRFCNLFDLIYIWGYQQCHDPRDKIYGLLGLADRSSGWPEVDYSLSVEQLYAKVVVNFAKVANYEGSGSAVARRLKEILQVDIKNSHVIEADANMESALIARYPDYMEQFSDEEAYVSDAESLEFNHHGDRS